MTNVVASFPLAIFKISSAALPLLLSEKLSAKVTAIHVMQDIPVLHIQSEKLLRATRCLQKRSPTYTIEMFKLSYKKGIVNKHEIASRKSELSYSGFL